MSPALFACRYIRKALRTRLIIRRCFCSRQRCARLWRYDVRKYTADAILLGEIQCKKMDNLMFEQRFQCELGWNKVKHARITITHVCFIALTLAGSLGWCCTLGLSASCSNSTLGTRQMLMHEKTCVIPIFVHRLWTRNHIYARINYALTEQPESEGAHKHNNRTLWPSLIFSLHLDSIKADDLKAKSNAIS